ncbi:MAG: hypothetical protein FD181_2979 [Prolixibacteraceae bacterium]|nr:MAG: hypothetical protein FD181_2979 [Prolixibacteraceae bacterium]
MIEIRELVIRATVEDSPRRNGENPDRETNPENNNKKGCCVDTVDALLQIINDKKER